MGYPAYPEMKDSGVEWLGPVPGHWEVKKLKYVVTYNDDSLPETKEADYLMEYVDISSVDLVKGITRSEQMTFDEAHVSCTEEGR